MKKVQNSFRRRSYTGNSLFAAVLLRNTLVSLSFQPSIGTGLIFGTIYKEQALLAFSQSRTFYRVWPIPYLYGHSGVPGPHIQWQYEIA